MKQFSFTSGDDPPPWKNGPALKTAGRGDRNDARKYVSSAPLPRMIAACVP
eukprot:CAMPEP_0113534402 /NCGR_PEP_ID=MMETSP0015_2-20120614/5138_1 /TAXON_ID=2838 /ORGANISM="Odontella" /LENGTH=50 /DNA_ID=CAMNT_0000433557 /DNA_START=332 /DNA_END=484 /DNA_ORIENTATION=- /assembly_acc=CAM_ASM_000160